MTSDQLKKRLDDQGRRAQEKLAKELGFASVEAMRASVAKNAKKAAPAASAKPAGKPAASTEEVPPAAEAPGGKSSKSSRKAEQFRQNWLETRREAKALREQLEAKEVEMKLREAAMRVGITDTDFALTLFDRHLSGLSEEQTTSFDERAFFEGLRAERPYLFANTATPAVPAAPPPKPSVAATTGVTASSGSAGGSAPSPPSPATVTQRQADVGKFDATKAKPAEVQKRMQELGLNPNNIQLSGKN
jgi:hypothetical protein